MTETEDMLQQLQKLGSEQTKKVLVKHGAREPFFGVKVADLTKIQKKIKKNHVLALALFDTGNSDAMYLAGMIADPLQMDENLLNHWAREAYWYMLSEYTVAPIASESPVGEKTALQWIESNEERIASAGWATLSLMLKHGNTSLLTDDKTVELLQHIRDHIHQAKNRVRYTMNGFVIAAGAYVPNLTEKALAVAKINGKIHVDMGGTACKVPDAGSYIKKVLDRKKNR